MTETLARLQARCALTRCPGCGRVGEINPHFGGKLGDMCHCFCGHRHPIEAGLLSAEEEAKWRATPKPLGYEDALRDAVEASERGLAGDEDTAREMLIHIQRTARASLEYVP